jgi:small-conductance mechanosensitive channel
MADLADIKETIEPVKEKSIEILQYEFLGNTVLQILFALMAFIVFKQVFRLIVKFVLSKLAEMSKTSETKLDDYIIQMVKKIHPRVYDFISLYLSIKIFLDFEPGLMGFLHGLLTFVLIFQIVLSCNSLIAYILKRLLKMDDSKDEDQTMLHGLILLAKILLWTIGFVLLLANIGVDITSLVTSLGIGGIAVALAVQNILGDIFAAFSIYFDKPFVNGDFIMINSDKLGVVKKVGIKTTRIQTLQGEELIVGNKELTSSYIQNFKRMLRRRVAFDIGVTYDTTTAELKRAVEIIREAINKVENTTLDRVNFREFAAYSLNIECVYYHESPDYADYMVRREEINWIIKDKFKEAGIDIAFPTRSLILENIQDVMEAKKD